MYWIFYSEKILSFEKIRKQRLCEFDCFWIKYTLARKTNQQH